jgi:hypothetical protein
MAPTIFSLRRALKAASHRLLPEPAEGGSRRPNFPDVERIGRLKSSAISASVD